ncbi:MAG TPA: FecR domain-containing protein [Candidatus Methylomirabilis sp.]|nr:FecR domain-containing protein [Candidatus Methylomirabilis sp.]
MNDDYLWDGSGEPDPEIQKLETQLSRFAHKGEVPEFPEIALAPAPRFWNRWLQLSWTQGLAAAAAIVLIVAAVGMLRWSNKRNQPTGNGWDIQLVAGTPRVGSHAVGKSGKGGELGVGQTLVTDANSKATLSVADVGTVDVDPNTRLRLIAKSQGRNRLALERGTIHAFIWAQPGEFAVDTPSAIAVDLGCQYTLHVDDSGAGILRTTLGWVGFKLADHEAFIPAGAACATRPKTGPGTPYFEDASETFRDALSKFDFGGGTTEERSAELSTILTTARGRDALTLWHLLARTSDADRGRVYDRLAALVAPPAGVTREGILRLDQKMLDLWWDQLGLGDVSLWRTWERSWSPEKN